MPDLRTRRGVELARVGSYELSTGWHEFTRAQLADIVAGAGEGVPARVKIGHHDPRFDGSPSLGVVTNLRLDQGGDLLLGDLEGVPGWLDDALPHAYPGRSIEASVRADGTVRLTALALLGQQAPAIDTIADLEVALAAAAASAPMDDAVRHVALSLTQLRASAQDPQAASRPDNERNPMDASVLQALAATYGLDPDTATEDEVNAAVLAQAPAAASVDQQLTIDTPAETVEPAATPVAEVAPEPVEDPVAVATHQALADATARVAELERREAHREELALAASRDSLADQWVREGRFSAAERGHYRALLDVDEARTTVLAASLAPDRVPVLQRSANTVTASAATGDSNDLFAATLNRLGVKRQEA